MVTRADGCRSRGGRIFIQAVGVPGGGRVEGVEHQLEDHGVVGEVGVVDEVKGAVPLDVLVSDAGLVDERGTDGGDDGFVEGLDDRVADACLGDGAVVELLDDGGTGLRRDDGALPRVRPPVGVTSVTAVVPLRTVWTAFERPATIRCADAALCIEMCLAVAGTRVPAAACGTFGPGGTCCVPGA
jgi:hypothetical protein